MISNLTQNQLDAVTFLPCSKKQHLIIEAGAGAGKTKVLSERVKWLLTKAPTEHRLLPSQIFLVTFTNDAQKELKDRIKFILSSHDLDQYCHMIHVSTIDGLFDSLVDCLYPLWWEKLTSPDLSHHMPPLLKLVSEAEVARNIEKKVAQFLNHNNFLAKELVLVIDFILSGGFKKSSLQFYSPTNTLENILKCMCQDQFLTSSIENLRIISHKIHPATLFLIANIHSLARQEYENRILRGEFTYADKIVFLKENLANNCPIFIKELIVDEYQDTNFLQHEILFNLIQNSMGRMVVVGDPKQSIYGFRGASVGVFKSLLTNSIWHHIELNKNFRTHSTLLHEINVLSKISFAWQDPRIPIKYLNSFFCQEAQKKYIGENPLTSGKTEFLNPIENGFVHIVSAFIPPKTKENNLPSVKMNEQAPLSYGHFLKSLKDQDKLNWNDIVVLCEKNKQIKILKEAFLSLNIPVKCIDTDENNKTEYFEDHVALALVKCLAGKEDLFDLYTLFISPLLNIPAKEYIEFFLIFNPRLKSGEFNLERDWTRSKFLETDNIIFPHINNFFILLKEYKIIACHNFFYAWQKLRWKLIYKFNHDAQLFCAQMDSFAFALYQELLNNNTRIELENSIFKIDSEFVLPENLSAYTLVKKKQQPHAPQDALEIKTIHKAKGLEWPVVCFYPKYGMNLQTGEFIAAQSEKNLDISWLNEDVEGLSVVKRIDNPKFVMDNCVSDEQNKTIHYAEIRKGQEENFERQRVFYTAFTRPQKKLVLFQPTMHHISKKSIKEISTEKKETLYKDYFEQDVYAKYINHNFNFSPQKKKETQTELCEIFYSKDKNIHLTQYNLQILNQILPKVHPTQKQPAQMASLQHTFDFSWSSINETPLSQTIKPSVKLRLQQKKEQRHKSHKGILYHAYAENKKSKSHGILFNLENKALYCKRELEIWSKNKEDQSSSRNIIDMLMVFKTDIFYDFLLSQKININEQPKKHDLKPSSDYLALVIDLKTGEGNQSHADQIISYKSLVEQIFDEKDNFAVCGALVYTSTNSNQNLLYNNQLIPFSSSGNAEKILFFP